MPYPPAQEKAIFLDIKRRKGERSAKRFMRKHDEKAAFEYSRKKKRR